MRADSSLTVTRTQSHRKVPTVDVSSITGLSIWHWVEIGRSQTNLLMSRGFSRPGTVHMAGEWAGSDPPRFFCFLDQSEDILESIRLGAG